MPEPLRVVDPETGELRAPGCDNCASLKAKVQGLQGDYDALTGQLATVVRQRDALKRDKDLTRQKHPKRAEVVEVFEHWCQRREQHTGRPCRSKLSADRFDAVKARLNEGYTVAELKLAIDGATAFPYVVNAQRVAEGAGPRRDDLELVARGGRRLEELAVLGHVWRKGL